MKILYFSQVSWRWIKQRPHFLACELAERGHDVVFKAISHIGTGKITDNQEKLKIHEVTGIRGSAKYKLSRIINKAAVRLDLMGKDFDVIILTYPFQLDFLPHRLRQKPLIYDCMDIVAEFYSGKTYEFMKEKERVLCGRANAVVVTSNRIRQKLMEEYQMEPHRISLIRNGFDRSCIDNDDQNAMRATNGVKCPSIGYMGTIDHWIDFDMIYDFCRTHEDYTMYFVGPIGKGAESQIQDAPENVIFTGAMKHKDALSFMKLIDTALIPFTVNELIKGVDPVKMYEYLALKKPVVSSYWEELEHFKEQGEIMFYQDKESFEDAIKVAGTCCCSCSDEFLTENTWKARAGRFEEILIIASQNTKEGNKK